MHISVGAKESVERPSEPFLKRRRWRVQLVPSVTILLCVPLVAAQQRAIDIEKSVITVRVYKTGFLSPLGHDHDIAAPIFRGMVDTTSGQVELSVKAEALQVRDPRITERDRLEIRQTMLSPKVLEAGQYPDIVFRSVNAERTAAGSWRVEGILTLHGQSRPIVGDVRGTGEHFVGDLRLKQTDFGIKPVKAAGGSIQVKDEVRIEFDIQLAPHNLSGRVWKETYHASTQHKKDDWSGCVGIRAYDSFCL